MNFAKFFRISIFIEHLRWLILYDITLLNSLIKMLVLSPDEHVYNEQEQDLSNCSLGDYAIDIVLCF